MRIRWPFQRARRDAGRDLAGQGDAAPPARPATAAWRELPPLEAVVGAPPLLAPVRPFASALAAQNPPPPILASLGHDRGLEGPKGLVAGIARPATTFSGGPTPAPVQRAPLRHGAAPDLVGAAVRAPSEPEPAFGTTIAEPTGASAGPALRRAAVVAAEMRPAGRMLNSAPEMPAARPPAGVLGPATAARVPSPVHELAVQRAPEPPAPAPVPAVGPLPPAISPAAPRDHLPIDAVPPSPDAPRLTIGQARRLGLGAPIGGGPVGAPLPPAAAAPSPAPAASPSHVQRAPAADASRAEVSDSSRPPRPQAPPGVAEGAASALAATRAAEAATPATPTLARRLGPSMPPVVPALRSPLISERPLALVQRAPLVAVQRAGSEADDPDTTGQVPDGANAVDGPVTVHRGPAADDTAAALEARAFTHAGEVYLPSSHGPLSSGPARSLLAHELTHVVQQRRLGSSLPVEHTPRGQALEAEAVAAERSGSLPLAPVGQPRHEENPDARLSTALEPQRAPNPAPAAAVDATTTVMLRAAPQRAPVTEAPPKPGIRHESSERRRPSEQELEDLARQLYARIGRRLRRDLLVDRERAGVAMDLPVNGR
jgi:hypothetical protein